MSLLFYTCANQPYEHFVPLYAASALHHVPTAQVEVGLEDVLHFRAQYPLLESTLAEHYGAGRVTFTRVPWVHGPKRTLPNTVRFITQPETVTSHVYVGDVDIIHLDSEAFPKVHHEFMSRNGLPYSNALRASGDRLTGLHYTEWKAMYPLPDVSSFYHWGDERVLAEICRRKGLPFPSEFFRPVHGIHASPNRDPGGRRDPVTGARILGWKVGRWAVQWRRFRASAGFQALAPQLREASVLNVRAIDALAATLTTALPEAIEP